MIESAGLAVLYTDWTINGGSDADGNAVELAGRSTAVVREQPDGSWRLVIDDPYSSG